jgi:hypothetical protein
MSDAAECLGTGGGGRFDVPADVGDVDEGTGTLAGTGGGAFRINCTEVAFSIASSSVGALVGFSDMVAGLSGSDMDIVGLGGSLGICCRIDGARELEDELDAM